MKKVAGLGQCSLDYIATVDKYPAEDTKPEVVEWTEEGGGPVATALVALSRLGVKTAFLGTVSDDHAGTEIKKGLRDEGVDTRGLVVRKGGRSQAAFIVANRRNAKRTVFWKRPTVRELKSQEVLRELIEKSAFLLVDGLMVEASAFAARMAGKKGIPVMLDAGRVRPGMMELAEISDYIVCSEEFAKDIAATPRKALQELARFKPVAATITLGKNGSITWTGKEVFRRGAFKLKAVDTTGAGDVFHGGYIYGLLRGWDIRRTVEFASALAALKCLKPGGRAGIPTLKETLRFLKNS